MSALFLWRLPRRFGVRPFSQASLASLSHPPPKTAVVVDDEAGPRHCFALVLSQFMGIRVLTADDSFTALQQISQYQPDLVISDISRPVMDGIEFVRELRLNHPELPVLIASASLNRDRQRRAFAAGATATLPKPFDIRTLVDAVRTLLRPRGRRSPGRPARRPSCAGGMPFNRWSR